MRYCMGGWMCGWNGCDVDVDVDVNSKEKINPFLPDLGRDGLRMREGVATSLVSDIKSVHVKKGKSLSAIRDFRPL